MAKTKKDKKPEKKSLLGEVADLAVEAAMVLGEIKLKGLTWYIKLSVSSRLDETFQTYKVQLSLNEKPDLDRIAALKRELSDGLFKDDPKSKASTQKQIAGIERELAKKRDLCETIQFTASVFEVKYGDAGTQFLLSFPDAALSALDRQKGRLGKMYKIRLEPVFA